MDLNTAHQKFTARIAELRAFCVYDSPWTFVCAAAFLEYLAKLVDGQDRGGSGYKEFVTNWLTEVRPAYSSFTYNSGAQDLPIQMYHVLRCGIVHTLSLIPDHRGKALGGRDRSIVLAHRKAAQRGGFAHLGAYSSGNTPDAAILVAEDFVDDIETVVALICAKAATDAALNKNICSWLIKHPLISAGA